ncbi:thioesterase [Solihabitans fulvus]|uniref:Thioesterase n=1 Tax=Solihabitans fulvus TaxID=1892852 RepID=A0A5B2WLH5_9PSEU|nr:alpha/beta fold hydrolase [Solihabitans fulvus]KAA2251396.1 thioesterase [Solihabitans fulvus]
MTAGEDRWLRRFHPADTSTRLACLPHAGGSATAYFPLSRALSGDVEVLAVQYPGRQDRRREPCVADLDVLADRVAEALTFWLDRPLALFGHSMGAALAFEVARRLETRTDGQPVALFVSGRHAAGIHRSDGFDLRTDDGVLAALRLLNGTDSALLLDDQLVDTVLPVIRSDCLAARGYRCRPDATVRCPITALIGSIDPLTTTADVLAWRHHTTGSFDREVFQGGHFYLSAETDRVAALVAHRLTARANR